jgi:eukaryotic-like serine/threonine-protein kinase
MPNILSCPSCAAIVVREEAGAVCPQCRTQLPGVVGADQSADETQLAADARTGAATSRSGSGAATSTGWLSSSGSIDHGRFAPGTLLGGRYRIVERRGRGGMGEVYRADDLKLGQPVALKFLPADVDRDPARLTQLHTEVRMARQVSHPNVCRVYDVGEYQGHTFLSMEYVDGEDLSSLLRRVGRFPEDRALELSRQICAGLAAAHERGVVHRDLKPANIMLDGAGKIRITDFGLAGAAGESIRAGTPAYMAPEQLGGGEVTPRSDIYALGLVLYELFTGRRALEGRNVAELIAKREQAGITQPSTIVTNLDPTIDRAIMRCLQPDPAERPASALAVAASLPGGDPLAAALAAGETPSPEMVAAAGSTSALRALPAIAALAGTLVVLALSAWFADRVLVTSLVPMPKPPILLAERARQILESVGHRPGADSAWGFGSGNFLGYLGRHPELGLRERLAAGNPSALQFWYRGSPTVMIPADGHDRVSLDDPAFNVSGMSEVLIDPEGRLIRLAVIPPQVDRAANAANAAAPAVNWKPLFDAAGLDERAFTPVTPEWTPRMFADSRVAWTGPMPGIAGQTLRLEAGSYRGKPIYFHPVTPWTATSRMAETIEQKNRVTFKQVIVEIVLITILVAAAVIARHNVRKGRGDRRGATRLAAFILAAAVGIWILDNKHVADPSTELSRFFNGQPLWAVGLLWVVYLAVEPYVRRFWPTTLVSWSRLMTWQWRDPLVGRDVLLGVGLGAVMHTLTVLTSYAAARGIGSGWTPDVPELLELLGNASALARNLNHVFNAVFNAAFAVFVLVLLKMAVRREWLASVLAIVLAMILAVRGLGDEGSTAINAIAALAVVSMIVLTIQRLGLVAATFMFFVNFILSSAVITLDTSRWFFSVSAVQLLIPAALALYGFYASRGGEPIFGARLLD